MQSENQAEKVQRTPLPVVAGILTLVAGGFKLLGILGVVVLAFIFAVAPRYEGRFHPAWLGLLAICLLVTGVVAIVGGIFTLKRKNWGWSLAGAIAAFLPFNLLGLTSIILVAMSKKEFES